MKQQNAVEAKKTSSSFCSVSEALYGVVGVFVFVPLVLLLSIPRVIFIFWWTVWVRSQWIVSLSDDIWRCIVVSCEDLRDCALVLLGAKSGGLERFCDLFFCSHRCIHSSSASEDCRGKRKISKADVLQNSSRSQLFQRSYRFWRNLSFKGGLPTPMRSMDAFYYSDTSTNPCQIVSAGRFEPPLSLATLRYKVRTDFIEADPRLRQIVRSVFGRFCWVDFYSGDEEVVMKEIMKHHVTERYVDFSDRSKVEEELSNIASERLSKQRPMWRLILLQDTGEARTSPKNCFIKDAFSSPLHVSVPCNPSSILVLQLHHCVADGVSLNLILSNRLCNEYEDKSPLSDHVYKSPMSFSSECLYSDNQTTAPPTPSFLSSGQTTPLSISPPTNKMAPLPAFVEHPECSLSETSRTTCTTAPVETKKKKENVSSEYILVLLYSIFWTLSRIIPLLISWWFLTSTPPSALNAQFLHTGNTDDDIDRSRKVTGRRLVGLPIRIPLDFVQKCRKEVRKATGGQIAPTINDLLTWAVTGAFARCQRELPSSPQRTASRRERRGEEINFPLRRRLFEGIQWFSSFIRNRCSRNSVDLWEGVKNYQTTTARESIIRPINIGMAVTYRRSLPTSMDNQTAIVLLRSLGETNRGSSARNMIDRLKSVKTSLDNMKRTMEPFVIANLVFLCVNFLPLSVGRPLVSRITSKLQVLYSNLTGPEKVGRLAGSALQEVVFWPPSAEDIDCSISIFSFNNCLHVSTMIDISFVQSFPLSEQPKLPQLLSQSVLNEIQDLHTLCCGTS